ncbi:MAG: hypothetical protein AAFV96_08620, partial [Pseudomonadota bacterium]
MERLQRIAVPILAIILFTALWELLVWANGWPDFVMASPSDLPAAYIRFADLFLIGAWETLWRTVVGLLLAVIVGLLLGMIMGFSRVARDGLYPLLVGFNAIPKATLVPVLALLFIGQHDFNTVMMAFLISFFPIAVSIAVGLSTLAQDVPILRLEGGEAHGDGDRDGEEGDEEGHHHGVEVVLADEEEGKHGHQRGLG